MSARIVSERQLAIDAEKLTLDVDWMRVFQLDPVKVATDAASAATGVHKSLIAGRSRPWRIVCARSLRDAILRYVFRLGYEEIGRLTHRPYTSSINRVKVASDLYDTDRTWRNRIIQAFHHTHAQMPRLVDNSMITQCCSLEAKAA